VKKILTILLILAVAGLVSVGAQSKDPVGDAVARYYTDWPGSRIIAQDDAVAKVAAGEAMTLIDIRRAADYAKGHLKGAINLPWGSAALSDNLKHLPQQGQVFVYCYTGQTAGQAVALLNVAGVPAQSIRFGWNLGISKVQGVDKVTSTNPTSLDTSKSYNVDRIRGAAYKAYYSDMAGKAGTRFANNIIAEAEAKKILDAKDRNVTFVSIRQAKDYAVSTLPARNTLIVYCYTGQTAGQAVATLRLLGYDAVSLRGGFGTSANAPLGWTNQSGYPVAK